MGLLVIVAAFVLLAFAAARWGADSRLLDADRATRWWPATPGELPPQGLRQD
jgi:hypothetical protein